MAENYKEQGNSQFNKGDYVAAEKSYTKAIELDPHNPLFYTNRSAAYFKMKLFIKSIEDSKKAISLDPNSAKVSLMLYGKVIL